MLARWHWYSRKQRAFTKMSSVVTIDVLFKCLKKLKVKFDKEDLLDMIKEEMTKVDVEFKFGKHKGKTVAEVYAEAPDYLRWLIKQDDMEEKNPELYAAAKQLTKKRKRDE